MRRAFASILTLVLLPLPLLGQEAPARLGAGLAGSYGVAGQLPDGQAYRGLLELEAGEAGALTARFRLLGTSAEVAPVLSRAVVTAAVSGRSVQLRWRYTAHGLDPAAAGEEVEARYDLAALRGGLKRGGQALASEQLERWTHLVVLHTNDCHAQLVPFKDVTTGRRLGGFAARSTLIKRARAEAARNGALLLLLDAGDVNTGVPESDLLEARPDFEAMNLLGYQAMAVGNHEFDKGLVVLRRQSQWARFPFLSANVQEEASGEPLFHATWVLERGGLRVGLLGLTTESTAFLSLPENRAGLRFEPALEAAAREVPRLRQRCDLVIAVTHIGYYPGGNYGTSTPGDVSLVRAVPGIDLVVGGHSHTALPEPVVEAGTPIVQCQDRGRYLGRVDVVLDAQRKVVLQEGRLIPVVVEDPAHPEEAIPEDPDVVALLRPWLERINGRLDAVVAQSPGVLDGERPHVRGGDTNLAFLITDAYRHVGQTELAFAIGGGIRSSIDQGPITYREVLTSLPFRNGLVRGRLSGRELLEVLALAAKQVAPSGGWLHASGLTWTLRAGQAEDVRVGGQPLDPERLYTVTCDRFLGDGGERYDMFKQLRDREVLPLVDSDALRVYLEAKGVPDYAGEVRCRQVGPPAAARETPAPAPAQR